MNNGEGKEERKKWRRRAYDVDQRKYDVKRRNDNEENVSIAMSMPSTIGSTYMEGRR